MKEDEFFNKLIDATSNVLTKIIEELNRFRTDNIEYNKIESEMLVKRKESIEKRELKVPKFCIEEDEVKITFLILNSIQKVLFKLVNDSLRNIEKWELKQKLIHHQETLNMIVTSSNVKKIVGPMLLKCSNVTTNNVIEMIKSSDIIVKDLRNYSSKLKQ
jgi:hypothetical protein